MSDDLNKLKRDYRSIEAPAHLATRIKAQLGDRAHRQRSWIPAVATVAVAVAVVAVTPNLIDRQDAQSATASTPSLSLLSRVARVKPSTRAPNLSNLRSVKTPPLPAKPKLNPPKPRSFFDIKTDVQKETDYA